MMSMSESLPLAKWMTRNSPHPPLRGTLSPCGERAGVRGQTGGSGGFPRLLSRIKTLKDVVDWGLCTGCGACYYACARGGISLVNVESVGIRPRFETAECAACTACLAICPGYQVDARPAPEPGSVCPRPLGARSNELDGARDNPEPGSVCPRPLGGEGHRVRGSAEASKADREFGHALEIWEGYAADPEIRHYASSGGILSALALYCLEKEGMEFVLHSAMDEAKPWANRTVQSRTRSEILACTGSRYSPASPCDGLRAIEESDGPCVFIGKPCDVAAVNSLRSARPALNRHLGLVLTFFCAGTPSSRGTLNLIESLGVSPQDEIRSVRYRGEGWPGRFKVVSGDSGEEKSLSYMDSWGRLAHDRPLRCHLCPDGLGQVADISCGDAWEKFENNGDSGRSIVLVRTERGRAILHRAIAANYVELKPVSSQAVLAAQPNLLSRRRELFGRLLAMRLLRIPIPRFRGFSLFQSWKRLPRRKEVQTILGTVRRIVFRGMWRRRPVF